MSPKHSPTPWKVFTTTDGTELLGVGREDTAEGITDYRGALWGSDEEALANAHLIVRAVNCHEEMLEALRGDPEAPEEISPLSWLAEAIKELRNRGPSDDCEDPDAYWEMVSEIESLERKGRAAVAKAEGRS